MTSNEELLKEVLRERFGDAKTLESERPKKGDVLPPPRRRT